MQIRSTLMSVTILAGFGLVAMAVADIGPFSSIQNMVAVQNATAPATIGAGAANSVAFDLLWPGKRPTAMFAGAPRVISSPLVDADIQMAASFTGTGRYKVLINGVAGTRDFVVTLPHGNDQIRLTDFENQAPIRVQAVVYNPTLESPIFAESEVLEVRVDTEGPILTRARLSNDAFGNVVNLRLQFAESDLGDSARAANAPTGIASGFYSVERVVRGVNPDDHPTNVRVTEATVDGDVVALTLGGPLRPGLYQVTVGPNVKDAYGNPAGQLNSSESQPQIATFSAIGPAQTGPAVEFPQFTRRPPPDRNSFNPGNHVETRVVRLYYNRDAHRVAQVINRNLQSYNQAGVNAKRQQSNMARSSADDAKGRVDQLERQGIDSANRRDQARKAVEAAQRDLAQRQSSIIRARQIIQELNTIAPPQQLVGDRITSARITGASFTGLSVTNATLDPDNETFSDTARGTISAGAIADVVISSGVVNQGITSSGAIRSGSIVRGTITKGRIVSGEVVLGEQNRTTNELTGATINQAIIEVDELTGATVNNVQFQANPATQARINALRAELVQYTGSPNSTFGNLGTLTTAINTSQQNLTNAQGDMNAAQEQLDSLKDRIATAAFQSQLANRNQFEAEVAAATADPDSYAPARLDSIDPVFQVSVSVVGEGLIQLRGPIQGINEIRKMINQMDAPVGQVKVGIFTVQVNGEHGDKMEEVAAEIEGHIDLSRTMTNRSLQLIRRAVQDVASQIVEHVDSQHPGHRQVDRDRKYVYEFFGRDFIDELLAMDSEFIRTENKLLSLNSMDTVSLSQAMFILALAKNDVRQQILARFNSDVQTILSDEEYKFRRAQNLWPKKLKEGDTLRRLFGYGALDRYRKGTKCKITEAQMNWVHNKSQEWNRFANFNGFFTSDVHGPNTLNPLQREFIRLAQIFKSQLVAEMEVEQRVIERGLIQDNQGDIEAMRRKWLTEFNQSQSEVRKANRQREEHIALVDNTLRSELLNELNHLSSNLDRIELDIQKLGIDNLINAAGPREFRKRICDASPKGISVTVRPNSSSEIVLQFTATKASPCIIDNANFPVTISNKDEWSATFKAAFNVAESIESNYSKIGFTGLERVRFENEQSFLDEVRKGLLSAYSNTNASDRAGDQKKLAAEFKPIASVAKILYHFRALKEHVKSEAAQLQLDVRLISEMMNSENVETEKVYSKINGIQVRVDSYTRGALAKKATDAFKRINAALDELQSAEGELAVAKRIERASRLDLDHKKMLDYLIDQRQEKYIELVEGTRSHIANVDNYLKRLAIALEDDFKVQFYDPAFAGVREAGRRETVNLGQIERTTILANNRQFAKVNPQATMEFDLPKRNLVITEAMNGAKALMQDYGALASDPTFLGLTGALSGNPAVGGGGTGGSPAVKPVFPSLGTDSQPTFLSGNPSAGAGQKSALEKLIPDPAIYKFQTGTGFEIRPVIQPDGYSIIYNFKYLYTTNVREPVDPNEKHLGRIKQQFIDTEVQTSSYELREISRYQVALKASRTGRGVPLLEEIPIAGALFRPGASDESSLQQNIILGQTTVYPTLFDLMGLRWSKHVADLDYVSLREQEHVVRGRNQNINDVVFERSSSYVDRFLDIKNRNKDHYRPDFYHPKRQTSPYHPSGFIHPDEVEDPSGRGFYRGDPRPEEIRHEPPFDEFRGGPAEYYQKGRERISDPGLDRHHPGPHDPSIKLEVIEQSSSINRPRKIAPARKNQRIAFPPPAPASQSIRRMRFDVSDDSDDEEPKWTEESPTRSWERNKNVGVGDDAKPQDKPNWRTRLVDRVLRRK